MSASNRTAPSVQSPISAAEFAARLTLFKPSKTIAVAFSGGPDSLALLVLAAQWAKRRSATRLIALTVDHGLRKASAAEAREAAKLARALGVPHRILRWRGKKPATGVQAAAREARYALLAAECRKLGAADLLVAHHLEDQAETFLLRLARGSGVDGLAAMRNERLLDAGDPPVRLLRPLLDLPRARLAATVSKTGLDPILDPSNENPRFDRVRMRQALELLGDLGLTAERLAGTAHSMARARAALEAETASLLARHAVASPFGYVAMDAGALVAAPAEIGLRALAAIIKAVSGGVYGPRMEALEGVYAALCSGQLGRGRTLGGVKLALLKDQLVATRELAAVTKLPPLQLTVGKPVLWDGRFQIRLTASPARPGQFEVRALGPAGISVLKRADIALSDVLANVPRSVIVALPGLWLQRELVAAPHFGTFDARIKAKVTPRFTGLFEGAERLERSGG